MMKIIQEYQSQGLFILSFKHQTNKNKTNKTKTTERKQDKILKAVGIDESNIIESKRQRKPKKIFDL